MKRTSKGSFPTGRFVKVHSVRVNPGGTIDIVLSGSAKKKRKAAKKRKRVAKRKPAKRKKTRKTAKRRR